jgi:hypothetical protein
MKNETNIVLNIARQDKMEERINSLIKTVAGLTSVMSTEDMERFINTMDSLKPFQVDPEAGLFTPRFLLKNSSNVELTKHYQGVYIILQELCDSYLVDNKKNKVSSI